MKRIAFPVWLTLFTFSLFSGPAQAGYPGVPLRYAAQGGPGGDLNLVVQQVSFSPARARVGDPIQFVVTVQNLGEQGDTIQARILANDKEVAGTWFTWDGMQSNPVTQSFVWDTAGSVPGEYRIKADFSDLNSNNPFGGYMTVDQPLILVPAGAPFPDGQPAGGTATQTAPGFRKSRPGW